MSVVLLAVPGLGLLLSAIALHESIDVSLTFGILHVARFAYATPGTANAASGIFAPSPT
jgi:hypothetical protein